MLGIAKCGHCGQTGTKIVEIEPNGARYKQSAICCTHCSAILGVGDYYNVGTLLKTAEKERVAMTKKIDQLQYQVDLIVNTLRR